ncbi:MAG: DNA-processing protein DprA [bacterium]
MNPTGTADRERGERPFWIALNAVPDMRPELFFRLLEHFGAVSKLWKAAPEAIEACPALTPAMRKNLLETRERMPPGAEPLEEKGVRALTLHDDGYPGPLKGIPLPPPVLYVRGEWTGGDERSIAIVGSRACTQYGRDMAAEIAGDLARGGVTVVSGLAHGIDACAHRGALAAGGRTIAVLGSGLDRVYPALNLPLSDEIAASGALVSEFAPGVEPEKRNFPRRNRIISGLALGTLVIEAGKDSGAMITAEHAAEQGRLVLAVPGDVKRQLNAGPHALIRGGALLVESAADVLEKIGAAPAQQELSFEERLDEHEQRIYNLISAEPRTFDEVCLGVSMSAPQVSSKLMMMEMKGLVRQLPGKMYVRRK